MKLVLVFVLAAIPICCYASSSGCHAMDDIIAQTINSSVSVADYQGVVKSYAPLPFDKKAVSKLKQCFLDQSEDTLTNVKVMVGTKFNVQLLSFFSASPPVCLNTLLLIVYNTSLQTDETCFRPTSDAVLAPPKGSIVMSLEKLGLVAHPSDPS
ncbi:secretoglobin family 2A member 2-like [Arvicola amphibius]|uniref:secretoglobin family 2A member 2-like n=1 Tax=Arvicola amphibius TaxID=1047088 RepID=UPI001C095DDF|nr:secretoglobin family 2A member 2-like [Arvicola amphibius]